jgi:hypothetical protein
VKVKNPKAPGFATVHRPHPRVRFTITDKLPCQGSVAESQFALPPVRRKESAMLNNLSAETREWYQQAVNCARQADAQTDPKVKQQYLELKRLWLLLARSYGFTESLTDFSDETK